MHDLAVYGAMAGIAGVTIIALFLGVADGLVASAITALAGLGGAKIGLEAATRKE
jgi:hypothetical protein